MQEIKKRQKDHLSKTTSDEQELQNSIVSSTNPSYGTHQDPTPCNSYLANIVMFIVVAIFVWFVQWLVKNLS